MNFFEPENDNANFSSGNIPFEKDEFVRLLEETLEKILRKYLTPDILSYLSLNVISLSKKINNVNDLMNIKSLTHLLGVSRQTIHNWKKKEKTRKLIEPFVHKVGNLILYDPVGICLVLAKNEEKFACRNYSEFLDPWKNTEDYKYKLIKAKIAGNQIIPDNELDFYYKQCEIRGDENILKKRLQK